MIVGFFMGIIIWGMPKQIIADARNNYKDIIITINVTPTSIPTITPTPTALILQKEINLNQQINSYILDAVNNFRKSTGLYEVRSDQFTCAFAKIRAKEIVSNFNHDGFYNRVNNRLLPYPQYSSVTENIAMTTNYKNVINLWANSPGHAANMRRDTRYVCIEHDGNYYSYEGWRP